MEVPEGEEPLELKIRHRRQVLQISTNCRFGLTSFHYNSKCVGNPEIKYKLNRTCRGIDPFIFISNM